MGSCNVNLHHVISRIGQVIPSHHMNHIATYHVQTQQMPKLQTCFKASYWTNPAALLIPTVRSWLFKRALLLLDISAVWEVSTKVGWKFYWEIEYQQQFWHQSGLQSGLCMVLCMGLCFGERISIRKSWQKQTFKQANDWYNTEVTNCKIKTSVKTWHDKYNLSTWIIRPI